VRQPTALHGIPGTPYSSELVSEVPHEVSVTIPTYFASTASRGRTPALPNTCWAAVQASVLDTDGAEKAFASVPRLFR
jgi:hypothetical protein